MLLRDATEADFGAIEAIYAHWVDHGSASFELVAPARDEIARRNAEVRARGLPWLVAEQGGRVLGYAYANWFRPRPAYRFALESSVYVAPGMQRGGIARLLMVELMTRCELAGARQMIAVIGDSGNAPSIALHRSLGFQHAGTLQAVGWKFERWLDVVLMQRALGRADRSPPTVSAP